MSSVVNRGGWQTELPSQLVGGSAVVDSSVQKIARVILQERPILQKGTAVVLEKG